MLLQVLWLNPTSLRSAVKPLGLPSLSAAKTRSSKKSISVSDKQNGLITIFNHFRDKAALCFSVQNFCSEIDALLLKSSMAQCERKNAVAPRKGTFSSQVLLKSSLAMVFERKKKGINVFLLAGVSATVPILATICTCDFKSDADGNLSLDNHGLICSTVPANQPTAISFESANTWSHGIIAVGVTI
jgi:hypothetical protein